MTAPTNTRETAASAVRRFACELQRLAEGLEARGIEAPPASPIDTAYVDAALAAIDRLAYERRILGRARSVLDVVAEESRDPAVRREAAAVAQAIVDEIGHPVTGEAAQGRSFREQLDVIRQVLGRDPNRTGEHW